MNYVEFNKNLKEGNIQPLYLFSGEEIYLIDETITRVKNKYLDKSLETINFATLNGKSITQEDIINACETLPFMSQKKIVLLNEVSLFLENGITDEKEFYDYLDKIGDHCIFIITDRNGEIKKTRKFYKYFKKNNIVVEFNKLTKTQLQSWIKNILKANKKEMNIAYINYFMDRSSYFNRNHDTNLYSLKSELEKLINYSEDVEIKKEDIESISQKTTDSNIFDLLGYLSEGNGDKALQVFNELYSLDEPALKILFMITRQVRLVLNYKLYSNKGYDDNQIRNKLKISPYELKKISQQARKHDINVLKRHFSYLLIMDKRLKSSSMDEKLEMEMLILRISTGEI